MICAANTATDKKEKPEKENPSALTNTEGLSFV